MPNQKRKIRRETNRKKVLTQTDLRHLLYYNTITGCFIRRVNRPGRRKKIGDTAGYVLHNRDGKSYWLIEIYGRAYLAHRLAFFYMTGRWPRSEMDHRDGNGLNNAWSNIRESTRSQNTANTKHRRDNKLGVKGVHKRANGTYRSQLRKNGKIVHSSHHGTLEAAARAYKRAARKYHGEFSMW